MSAFASRNAWEGVRSPDEILWPTALGRMKACRLSFGVALVDTLLRGRWRIELTRSEIGSSGKGHFEYRIDSPEGVLFRFYAWLDSIPEATRRAAPAGGTFDIVGALVEGALDEREAEETRRQLRRPPTDGRASASTLAWVRANRSQRVFEWVTQALASGQQPDASRLCRIGYLLRTLYYQANGMAGTRLFEEYPPGHPLGLPYAAQCLCSYLTRQLGVDLTTHLARRVSPSAVELDRDVSRYLGLGNSTGLGLMLFLDHHPRLIDRWLVLREHAVSEAQAQVVATNSPEVEELLRRLARCAGYRREDRTDYGTSFEGGPALATELDLVAAQLRRQVADTPAREATVGELLGNACRKVGDEAVECVRALVLDARDDLIKQTLPQMIDEAISSDVPELRDPIPTWTVGEVRATIEFEFDWALQMDVSGMGSNHWAWYKAGLGEYPGLVELDGASEPFLDWADNAPRSIQRLAEALRALPQELTVAALADRHPELMPALTRVASGAGAPYGQLRANLRDPDLRPMDATRFVLEAIKGFEKMEPIDLWGGRAITMQGAPMADELQTFSPGSWLHPPLPAAAREASECE